LGGREPTVNVLLCFFVRQKAEGLQAYWPALTLFELKENFICGNCIYYVAAKGIDCPLMT